MGTSLFPPRSVVGSQGFDAQCDRAFELLGSTADAVLIVPPFADLYFPSLGIHLLQAAGERAGLRVRILYANLLFAALGGDKLYRSICRARYGPLWGERVFTAAAFGLPPLGYEVEKLRAQLCNQNEAPGGEITFDALEALEREAAPFCSALGKRFAALRFRVAGASSNFQQTAAATALLAQVKRARPEAITIIGGANCEGEMARGIASLEAPIDYIFSGECESVFPDFLRRAVAGEALPSDRIIQGKACFDMDSLPEPSYEDYFAQLDNALPSWRGSKQVWLPYESSRGCWWGARQHCTFCGLNGQTMGFREKSPDRMMAELHRLLRRHPTGRVFMTDNIIPYSYFRSVLPRMAEELPPVRIYYETKSNLRLDQVELLHRAGINYIQPGIEALSSSLLRRMKKGVLARQNLELLRYARACGVTLTWNLLTEFPGDRREDYEETLALMPLIHHLHPPAGLFTVSIERFSPYFKDAADYGVSNLEPSAAYSWAFPRSADLRSLAYHFTGQFECAHTSHPELRDLLERAYRPWRDSWTAGSPPPALNLSAGDDGYYTLMDTRGVEGTEMFQFLDEEQARAVLIAGPMERQPLAAWAIERKLAVSLDGWCVPLAVANLETWRRLEARALGTNDSAASLSGALVPTLSLPLSSP